jgi:threonine aldolase
MAEALVKRPSMPAPAPAGRGFASDNNAAVHREIFDALRVVNVGHQPAYGADKYTRWAEEVVKSHFGEHAEAFFVFNGTGANVVALQSMARPWEAVVCASTAHINTSECGAVEHVAGLKLLPVPGQLGKITPAGVAAAARGLGNRNRAQPRVVSITQSTELGTCYSVQELTAICGQAHDLGMTVHCDGARLSNAAASLGTSLRELTTGTGVDVVSFGGTKSGLMFGEAVVVLRRDVVAGMEYIQKAATQLASKMRYVAVQFGTLLTRDIWMTSARQANSMAALLERGLRTIPGVQISYPVEANAVFARVPAHTLATAVRTLPISLWNQAENEVRMVASFDTTESDVSDLVSRLRALVREHPATEKVVSQAW